MPFIKQWRRHLIMKHGLESLDEIEPGDRCYVFYKQLVDEWRDNPRWSTVHKLFVGLATMAHDTDDDYVARALAWQVFFALHVLPYEKEKRKENGDI